jgi:hypothetical protein
MNYPYPRLFLDIQLAKRQLEKVLRPADRVTDGTSDGHRRAEPVFLCNGDRTNAAYRGRINCCRGEFVAVNSRPTTRACPLSFEFPAAHGLVQLEPAAARGRFSISASPLVFPR